MTPSYKKKIEISEYNMIRMVFRQFRKIKKFILILYNSYFKNTSCRSKKNLININTIKAIANVYFLRDIYINKGNENIQTC